MLMIPSLDRNDMIARARKGRYVFVMRGEGNWAMFRITDDMTRGDAAIYIDADTDPEFSSDGYGTGLYDIGDEYQGNHAIIYYHSKDIRAILPRSKAAALAKQLIIADKKFAEETAQARVAYQLGMLVAMGQTVD